MYGAPFLAECSQPGTARAIASGLAVVCHCAGLFEVEFVVFGANFGVGPLRCR